MDCHHGGVVLVGGYLYGTNHITHTKGNWLCVDWKTGKQMYEKTWHTKGSLIYADGMLYCFEERKGHVGLVKAMPTDFKVISPFQVPKQSGPAWAHPVISDKKLYLRWDDVLRIYDIGE